MEQPKVAVFKIDLAWKDFSLNLGMVNEHIKSLDSADFCGLQAHDKLEAWFTAIPSEEIQEEIKAYWEALDEHSEEASSYISGAAMKHAMDAAKLSAASKDWNGLSAQQKKMLMGAPLLEADIAALVTAFPMA